MYGLSLILLIAFHLSANVHECWTVFESSWDKELRKEGIDPVEAKKRLESNGVCVVFDDLPNTQNVCLSKPISSEGYPYLLKDYGDTAVYYAPNPRVRHHLWVVLNRPADYWTEVSSEEALSLQATTNKIVDLLKERFQISDIAIARWNRVQERHFAHRVVIEILPPRLEYPGAHHLLDKMESNFYVFLNRVYPPTLSAPSQIEIDTDVDSWKEAFQTHPERPSFSMSSESQTNFPWIHTKIAEKEGTQKLIDCFYTTLLEKGVPIERTVYGSPSSDPISVARSGCSLCRDTVISSQQIAETFFSRLLCNHKSSENRMSFLVLPKRHVKTSSQLRKEEIQDLHELTTRFLRVLREKVGEEFTLLEQTGATVGQTQQHAHIHIHLPFSPLQFSFNYLGYDERTPLSQEELQKMIKSIQELL